MVDFNQNFQTYQDRQVFYSDITVTKDDYREHTVQHGETSIQGCSRWFLRDVNRTDSYFRHLCGTHLDFSQVHSYELRNSPKLILLHPNQQEIAINYCKLSLSLLVVTLVLLPEFVLVFDIMNICISNGTIFLLVNKIFAQVHPLHVHTYT